MAKCPVCDSRKGKRKCQVVNGLICSLCCGQTRTSEPCRGCIYYQKPRRKYSEVPAYSVAAMEESEELATYGNSIEGALCAYDASIQGKFIDDDAIRIVELLIDKYHFQDQNLAHEEDVIVEGVAFVDNAICEDLNEIETAEIVKILGVIRYVARRRTRTGREYMEIIHQYVGQRIAKGLRAL